MGMCLLLAAACLIVRFDAHFPLSVALMKSNGVTHNELLAIQVSVTFIVVSVVTAFSQKNDLIYWEDAMRYKLEKPALTNFCALSSYLLADLLFSLYFVFTGQDYVYFTFLLSIVILSILTYRMIGAFFMHDTIKNQLERDFSDVKSKRRTSKKCRDLYRDYKRITIQNTIKAIEERDVETVCENMAFLYSQQEAADVDFLIKSVIESQQFFMLSSIIKVCQFIFAEKEHIIYYIDICRQILSDDSVRFVKSIVRSMGEYIVCDSDANPQIKSLFDEELKKCVDDCNSMGFMEIADEIKANYQKQLNGYYDNKS